MFANSSITPDLRSDIEPHLEINIRSAERLESLWHVDVHFAPGKDWAVQDQDQNLEETSIINSWDCKAAVVAVWVASFVSSKNDTGTSECWARNPRTIGHWTPHRRVPSLDICITRFRNQCLVSDSQQQNLLNRYMSDFPATTNIILMGSHTNKLQSIKLKFQNKGFTYNFQQYFKYKSLRENIQFVIL